MGSLSPDALERLAQRAPKATTDTQSTHAAPDMLGAVLDDLRALDIATGREKPYDGGGRLWELDSCPYSDDHSDGAYLVVYPDGVPYVRCHHDRCRDKCIQNVPESFPRILAAIAKHRTVGPTLVGETRGKQNGPPSEPPPPRDPSELDPGHVILDRVHAWIGRFVAYPSVHAHIAHTLWIAHAHLMSCWDSTPRIAFLSPEPGSGKSRALEVSEPLVPRAVTAMNMTAAYLFRKVGDAAGTPTILFDEVDTVFGPKAGPHEEVRGLLNAGHRRGATAGRVEMHGKTAVPTEYPAYCAVALAGLGDLPDTILTRSVIVRMRRRAPGERIGPWRARIEEPAAHQLRAELAEWCAAIADRIGWPNMPPGVEDRDADVWEPLIAVADVAGGEWPVKARAAAVAMVNEAKDRTPSLGVRLLSDLRVVFGQSDQMATTAILKALSELEESPWGEVVAGKPLNPRGLARRLNGYGVKSVTVRVGDATPKGYRREDLADAWERYLPPLPLGNDTSATSATYSPGAGTSQGGITWPKPQHRRTTATENPHRTGDVADVADVADFPESAGTVDPTPLRQACIHCGNPAIPDGLYCDRHRVAALLPTGTDGDYVEVI